MPNLQATNHYEQIVIGAGFAGLCAAALLTKKGYKTLLLEAHTVAGGCASFFKRKDFLFDVGATTVSGLAPNKPIYKVFHELGLLDELNLKRLDVGISIKMKGQTIKRYRDSQRYMQEFENSPFQDSITNVRDFFKEVHALDKLAWELIDINERLLPVSLDDYIDLFQVRKIWKNLEGLKLVPGLFSSTDSFLARFNLHNNQDFKEFINEQLLITTQNLSSKTPYLSAALGLAYSQEVFYPYGGIAEVSKILERYIKAQGGEILYKAKAKKIKTSSSGFEVEVNHLKENKQFSAKALIPSIPIWNLAQISEGSIQKHFSKFSKKFPDAWGAFMVYGAFKASLELDSSYYQIHTSKPIPFCNSASIFASISLADDDIKAPPGWHTITISTHTLVENWLDLDPSSYDERKQLCQDFILSELYQIFPELRDCEKKFIQSATPKSFEFYTSREKGFVGGIAHSVDQPILNFAPSQSPHENLFLTGDTSFPGQGLAAVAYSAYSISQRIK